MFADKRRNTALVIQGCLGPTPLRDDGVAPDTRAADGVYAAVVQADAVQVNRTLQQRIERVSKYRALPVFGPQRELLRHEPPAPSRFTSLEAGRVSLLDKVSGIHPADFAEWWVNQWQNDLNINGFTVPNRVIGLPRLLIEPLKPAFVH